MGVGGAGVGVGRGGERRCIRAGLYGCMGGGGGAGGDGGGGVCDRNRERLRTIGCGYVAAVAVGLLDERLASLDENSLPCTAA